MQRIFLLTRRRISGFAFDRGNQQFHKHPACAAHMLVFTVNDADLRRQIRLLYRNRLNGFISNSIKIAFRQNGGADAFTDHVHDRFHRCHFHDRPGLESKRAALFVDQPQKIRLRREMDGISLNTSSVTNCRFATGLSTGAARARCWVRNGTASKSRCSTRWATMPKSSSFCG